MNVSEVRSDTTIHYPCIKVIWGIKYDTLGFIWDNHTPIYFIRQPYHKQKSRAVKTATKKYIEILQKEKIDDNILLRDLFYNRWGELYLVTIYTDPGIIIKINRLDDKFPHFTFLMTD